MTTVPKKTKYRLKFRNKIQTKKIFKHDARAQQGSCSKWPGLKTQPETSRVPGTASNLAAYMFSSSLPCSGLSRALQAWLPQSIASTTNAHAISKSILESSSPAYEQPAAGQRSVASFDELKSYAACQGERSLLFGAYGIAFQSHGKVRSKFVETIRLDIAKMLKKKGKVWLRLCCDTPVTSRPVETRMGKGKGAIRYYEAKVRPGQIFFEFDGLSQAFACEILAKINKKSPLTLKLVPEVKIYKGH